MGRGPLFPLKGYGLGLLICGLLALAGGRVDGARAEKGDLRDQYRRPATIPFPKDNPYSRTKATLGKMLFFDPRVSKAQNMNCVSCHNPSFGWEVPLPKAIGAQNSPLRRHAPAVVNLAWADSLFWDGRAESLEDQAGGPITAHDEMNMPLDDLVVRLRAVEGYRTWFEKAFPVDGLTKKNILKAIATFERTIVSAPSAFDRWVDGDESAISASAKRGFQIFNGKSGCSECHSGWNFTDNGFHDIGLATVDIGRAEVDKTDVHTRFAFKTPSLRNLTRRMPFMHDGSIADLGDVIDHYAKGGVDRPSLSEKMLPFRLTATERQDLIAFLKTLDSGTSEVALPKLPN